MLPAIFVAIAGAILFAMGLAHLMFTLFTRAFHPCDARIENAMKTAPVHFSQRMPMWRSWIGYNVGHALGAMWFGLIFAYLALVHSAFLLQSHFLVALGAVYLFYIPPAGIAIALASYIVGIAMAYAH